MSSNHAFLDDSLIKDSPALSTSIGVIHSQLKFPRSFDDPVIMFDRVVIFFVLDVNNTSYVRPTET